MINLLIILLIFHGLALVFGTLSIRIFDCRRSHNKAGSENRITADGADNKNTSVIVKILRADVIGSILLIALSVAGVEILSALNGIFRAVDIGWYIWIDILCIIITYVIYRKVSAQDADSDNSEVNVTAANNPEEKENNTRCCGVDEGAVRIEKSKWVWLFTIAGVLLVIAQIIFSSLYSINIPSAYRPLRYATQYYDAGVIDITKPMMLLIGNLGLKAGVHPAVVGFALAPIMLIPIYYGMYSMLLGEVLNNKAHKQIALVIICALHIWSYQSDYLLSMNMLVCPYAGAVYVIDGLLPLVAYYLIVRSKCAYGRLRALNVDADVGADTIGETEADDYCEEWDMKKHPIINARNIAIALGITVLALITLVFMLNNKINRLYDATVNLQTALDSRCSIYEFCPEEGKDPTGYLVKDSAGRLTMFGGGGIDDTDEVYDFIAQYGNTIDAWYIYGSEDADRGAYDGCVIYKDLEIKNVYEIERKDAIVNADSN